MNQICIYSDVDVRYVSLEYEEVAKLKVLFLDKLLNKLIITQLSGEVLNKLKGEIESNVSLLLRLRESTDLNSPNNNKDHTRRYYSNTLWNEVLIELNVKNENDVRIGTLIILYEMVQSSIKTNGSIFISDREFLTRYHADSILSYLRLKGQLDKGTLYTSIIHLYKSKKLVNKLDQRTFECGLDHLENFGLIYFDRIQNIYKLTARGYMFW